MGNLTRYAEAELRRAGWLDPTGSYGGMIGCDVLALIRVFEEQGHSGGSAPITIRLFSKLARFEPLTPLTYAPDEWNDISEQQGRPTWQNRRRSSVFSHDGGLTHFDLDSKSYAIRRRLSRYLGDWVMP